MQKISQSYLDALLADMPEDEKRPKRGKRKRRRLPAAFPDYGRSLVSQRQADPRVAGLLRALGYGTAGAVLGAGAGKLGGLTNKQVLLASIIAGLLAGVPGYVSGQEEQRSLNTKLLFLRRLGIGSPGELEAAEAYPGLVHRMATRGRPI